MKDSNKRPLFSPQRDEGFCVFLGGILTGDIGFTVKERQAKYGKRVKKSR